MFINIYVYMCIKAKGHFMHPIKIYKLYSERRMFVDPLKFLIGVQ